MENTNQFQKAATSNKGVRIQEGTRYSEDVKEQQHQQPKHHRQSSSMVTTTKYNTIDDYASYDPQWLKYPTYVDYANLSPQEAAAAAAAPISEQKQLVEERQQQPQESFEELSPFRTMTSLMSSKTTTVSRTNTFPFLLHQMLDVTDRYPEKFFIHTMHPMKLSIQEQLQDSIVVQIQAQLQQWQQKQQQQQQQQQHLFSPPSLTEQQQIEMIMESIGVLCFRPHDILRWEEHGRSFMIIDKVGIVKYFFPLFFPYQNEYASFQRQLNLYGFLRLVNPHKSQITMRHASVAAVGLSASSCSVEIDDEMALPKISVLRYYHEKFVRTRSDLCSLIQRTYHHKTGSIRPKGGSKKVRSLLLPSNSRSQYDPESEPDFDSFPTLRYIRKEPILESSSPMAEASIEDDTNLSSATVQPKGLIVKSLSTSSIASSTQWSLDRIHSNLDIAALGSDAIGNNDGDPTITTKVFMTTSNQNIDNQSQQYPGLPSQSPQEIVQPAQLEQQQFNPSQSWNEMELMEQNRQLFQQQYALWMASNTAAMSMANSMPELDTSSWVLPGQVRREIGVTLLTNTNAMQNHPLSDSNVTSMTTYDVNTNTHRRHMKVDDVDDIERHRRLEPSRTSDSTSSNYSSSSKKYSTKKRRSHSDSSIVVLPKKTRRQHFIGSEIIALTPGDVSSSVDRSATAYQDHRLVVQSDYLRRSDHHLPISTNETTYIATYDQETKELEQSFVSRGLLQTSVHPSHFSSSSVGLSFPTSSVSASSHLTTTNQSIHRGDDESSRGNRISSSMITSRLYQNIRHSPTRGSFTLSSPPRSSQTTADEHKRHGSSSVITHKTSDTTKESDPTLTTNMAVAPTNPSSSQFHSSSEESDFMKFLEDIDL